MAVTIPVVHDIICPWCYIGWIQARKLAKEFGVEFDWIPAELYPKQLAYDDSPSEPEPANKPRTPSRFAFICHADGVPLPRVAKPPKMRSFNVSQAIEVAKTYGKGQELIDILYHEYWEKGTNVNDLETLINLAAPLFDDTLELRQVIESDHYRDKVIEFDGPAHAQGIYNVPTFFIGEKRLAEQPFTVVRDALKDFLGSQDETPLYADVEFPHLKERPYVFVNMVATIDGKIVTGDRNEPVWDLGSAIDHATMFRLEAKADAVMSGAGSIRATGNKWNPRTHTRIAVTRSGNLDHESNFLNNGHPIVLAPGNANFELPDPCELLKTGDDELDWHAALKAIFDKGVRVINCLGGSEINAQLFKEGLIDEIFITVAPKIKLGADTPTIADGVALPRDQVQNYELLSSQQIGDEVFLRYKSKA